MSDGISESPDDAVTANQIGVVLTHLASRLDDELLSLSETNLWQRWRFRWNAAATIEWNVYEFSGALEHFKRDCRRWEEHHNGCTCVVERVRDTYLMPKIKAFLADLAAHRCGDRTDVDPVNRG